MKDFYLNKDFFNFYLGCYYPLGDNFYLFVKSFKTLPRGYGKSYIYDVAFCVKYENEFIECFHAEVALTSRNIVLCNLRYVLDSDLKRALHDSFPVSPAWLLPCTRVSVWLRRCFMSLNVYRNSDWL
ncbi:MAG: hypothetical protein IJ826_03035 [Bacteroidaceae bacterium]|nr:hypothetical protein [Bacteroidaceae bacterium]